jgi:hypothetical protein
VSGFSNGFGTAGAPDSPAPVNGSSPDGGGTRPAEPHDVEPGVDAEHEGAELDGAGPEGVQREGAGHDGVQPGGAEPGEGAQSGAGLPASGLVADGPWSESAEPEDADDAGHEDGARPPVDEAPAGGGGKAIWDSGIWRREETGADADRGGDEPTRVMVVDAAGGAAGDTPSGATDEASVGVPSGPNGPAEGSGLPSSGVVPTTAENPPSQSVSSPSPSSPSLSSPSPSSPSLPSQPVSTPPAASERLMIVNSPATSAAVPVSSAPMPEGVAPVSAAPIGVTAMPAAETDLVPDETGGLYKSAAATDAGLDHAGQAPVSAPPVSAPPASSGITAAPTSSGPTSSVSAMPGGGMSGSGLPADDRRPVSGAGGAV